MVEYLSIFMPNISSYTGPLQTICSNKQIFRWTPLHQKCFDEIKRLMCRAPILKPIQWNPLGNLSKEERNKLHVWVITDACPAGMGALIGQGEKWQTCHPAAFMSKKFTNTQCRYFAYELKALMRWQDDLMGGCEFTVITDHKALEYFKAKNHNSGRHLRWQAFFASFNCEIKYMEGHKNKVADALSQYYDSSTDEDLHFNDYVSADIHLDKNAEDIIPNRVEEYEELLLSSTLSENSEKKRLTAICMRNNLEEALGGSAQNLEEVIPPEENLRKQFKEKDLIEAIKSDYKSSQIYQEILENPRNFKDFSIKDGLITQLGEGGTTQIVVPKGNYERKSIQEIILKNTHEILGHLGSKKTVEILH